MKKTLLHHTRLFTAALCASLICSLCTGCGNTAHISEDDAPNASDTVGIGSAAPDSNTASGDSAGININIGTSSTASTSGAVDTDAFEPFLLRELSLDLSADQVDDTLSVFLLGLPGDVLVHAETLVSKQARNIQVTVTDGATGETLYDRTFSTDHIGEGQLSLVTDQNTCYLLETDCHEQMGYGSYTGEVFGWKDGEKVTASSFEAYFLCDIDAASRNFRNGEALTGRDEVIQPFQDGIERWSQDAELLTACDCMCGVRGQQDVFISTEENKYTPEDFYSLIWERPYASYTAGEFDEIMGYSGYYIDEMCDRISFVRYFFSQEGEQIARAGYYPGYDPASEIFPIDLDRDGSTELICSVIGAADGRGGIAIYKRFGNTVMVGDVCGLLDEEYDYYGSDRYLPEENMIEIFYLPKGGEESCSKKYEIDLDRVIFYPYTP